MAVPRLLQAGTCTVDEPVLMHCVPLLFLNMNTLAAMSPTGDCLTAQEQLHGMTLWYQLIPGTTGSNFRSSSLHQN